MSSVLLTQRLLEKSNKYNVFNIPDMSDYCSIGIKYMTGLDTFKYISNKYNIYYTTK